MRTAYERFSRLDEVLEMPEIELVCFATNSLRRPSTLPADAGVRVVYVASAGKPLRTGFTRDSPAREW